MFLFVIIVDDIWKLIRKMGTEFYPIYRIWSFTLAYVNIRHPDDMEVIKDTLNNGTHTLYSFRLIFASSKKAFFKSFKCATVG